MLRERGVDVRMWTSLDEATKEGVRLTDGEYDRDPLADLVRGSPVRPGGERPRAADRRRPAVVDEYLSVPGHPEIYACGDAAAVPDLTRPGEVTAMTAQHAERQGRTAARNIAASYGHGRRKAYRHHDLGFVVDLGGTDAAANPLGVPLAGLPAKAVTRGYHLLSSPANRARVATNWLFDAAAPRQLVQLGLVRAPAVPVDSASPELPRFARQGGPER